MNLMILGHNYAPELVGIGPYTTGLAEHFAAHGHSVTVLTSFPHYPRYRWQQRPGLFKQEIRAGVHIRRMPLLLPRRAGTTWRIIFDSSVGLACLAGSVGVSKPDLIIAVVPTLQTGFAAGLLSRLWGVPNMLLIQDLPIEAGRAVGMLTDGFMLRRAAAFERTVYQRADRIVVIGEQFRDNLLAKGVKGELIDVVPNWVDLESIVPQPPESDVRKRLAGPDARFLLVHAGTMAEKQGLETVVAAARLLATQPDIMTVLVGDGPARPSIEAEILAHQLNNIRVLGVQPATFVPRMFAAADALLLSQRTGLVDAVVPSKLLGYMAAGRPVIAAVNEASAAASLILKAGCGVIVEPEKPLKLAVAIRSLASDPGLRARLGRSGRAFAEERFAKPKIMARWDRLISDVVAVA